MEIKIGKSAHTCAGCERDFVHEESIWSLVRLRDQALQREDYCGDCWPPADVAAAFSVWSALYEDPKVAEQQPPEVFSPLRQTFYESVEATARTEAAKAYLAAQILKRQKVFRQIRDAEGDEAEVRLLLYLDRLANNLVEVRDPNLSAAELEAGREALLARLAELEAPEEDAQPPEEDDEDAADRAPSGDEEDAAGTPGEEGAAAALTGKEEVDTDHVQPG